MEASVYRRHGPKQGISGVSYNVGAEEGGGFAMAVPWRN